ncbi:hypothetical protein KBX71_18295 [Micromonospora sp. D93]|uniref:hypothetical protein n=1 Tax=Micromonospora sp. D93 TaxID=2824886 RepID=UPI001B35CD86|nr:hypothetical protein [Micromonospora sp. D93]MBQ1019799.1 hypothetical protein [Micromonospora sp. D93]
MRRMEDPQPEQTNLTFAERGLVDDLDNPISLSDLLTPPIMSDSGEEQASEEQASTTTD